MSRIFIILGIVFLLVGIAAQYTRFDRLPGDVSTAHPDFSFYFPFTTMLVVSVILTLLLNLFTRK